MLHLPIPSNPNSPLNLGQKLWYLPKNNRTLSCLQSESSRDFPFRKKKHTKDNSSNFMYQRTELREHAIIFLWLILIILEFQMLGTRELAPFMARCVVLFGEGGKRPFKFPPTRSKHHTLPCHNNIIHPIPWFDLRNLPNEKPGVLEGIPATFGLLLWLWWWCILKPGPQWFRSTDHRNFGPTPLGSWVWWWLCYVNNVIYIKLLITMYLQVITDMVKV